MDNSLEKQSFIEIVTSIKFHSILKDDTIKIDYTLGYH